MEFRGHSCVPGPVPPALGKGGQGSRYGLDESLASAGSLELWLPALAAHHSHLLGVGRWVLQPPGVGLDEAQPERRTTSLESGSSDCHVRANQLGILFEGSFWFSRSGLEWVILRYLGLPGSPAASVVLEGRSQSEEQEKRLHMQL